VIESPAPVGPEQRRNKAAARSEALSLLHAHSKRIALAHWTGPYDPVPLEALQLELAETSRHLGVTHAALSDATLAAWCKLDVEAIRSEYRCGEAWARAGMLPPHYIAEFRGGRALQIKWRREDVESAFPTEQLIEGDDNMNDEPRAVARTYSRHPKIRAAEQLAEKRRQEQVEAEAKAAHKGNGTPPPEANAGSPTPPEADPGDMQSLIEASATEGILDSDIANAVRLAKHYGRHFRFVRELGFVVYEKGRWVTDIKGDRMQRFAKDAVLSLFDEIKDAPDRKAAFHHAKKSQANTAINAMIHLARSERGIALNVAEFDADPMVLNVANGTLDLRTSELRPHRREDLLTKLVPIEYDPKAECALWDAFLWRITGGSAELYAYLQKLVGYLLTGLTTEQVLHFLFGPGANGKSVFCEIVRRLLGEYAIVASPELIMMRRHSGIPNDVARLRGVRAALMNETSQGARFDEAKLKDLTGGDSLNARFLHQEFFDFKASHKLLIRGNHKPGITGQDEAIWRRLRLIPFTVQIPPEERDPDLTEKLSRELPGILRWALEGCAQWQNEGLTPPDIVVGAVNAYREESDILGRFITECCDIRKAAEVGSGALFKAYQTFCEQAGERWIPAKDLPDQMQRKGFEHKRGAQGKRLYLGIEMRSNAS
jgi:P4 family phage/plasmid primase-like protien